MYKNNSDFVAKTKVSKYKLRSVFNGKISAFYPLLFLYNTNKRN